MEDKDKDKDKNKINNKKEDREEKVAFIGEDDELVPNCEGQPCNFVYDKKNGKKDDKQKE